MSKTSSLIPHIPILSSHDNYQSSIFPKIISDSTKLIPNPSQVLSNATKLLTEPSKILSDTAKILPSPTKILSPKSLLSGASKIISPTASLLIKGPSKILSSLLSSATNSPLTSMAKVLSPLHKLLELLIVLPLSFSPRHFVTIGAVLLLLAGMVIAGTVLGLIILLPLIVVLSPICVPASTALFVVTAGFWSLCGFVLVSVIVVAWLVQHLFNSFDRS